MESKTTELVRTEKNGGYQGQGWEWEEGKNVAGGHRGQPAGK